jgi:hypothetical protein
LDRRVLWCIRVYFTLIKIPSLFNYNYDLIHPIPIYSNASTGCM